MPLLSRPRECLALLSGMLVGLAFTQAVAAQAPRDARVDLVIRAHEVHVGDGQVLIDAAVAIDDGRIVEVALAKSLRSVGVTERRVETLLPGLVATVVPEDVGDAVSADSTRRAASSFDEAAAQGWSEWGVTTLAVTPGRSRFVSGRAGLVRLVPGHAEIALDSGAVCASLSEDAQDPPSVFDAPLRTTVDNPLAPSRPQRPSTSMAAVGELRRLIASAPDFEDVRTRRVPLRIHADAEEDVRRALSLATELHIDVVIEGGAESWKLAKELAAGHVPVVLDLADPTIPARVRRSLDLAPDAAGRLERAGVEVSLAPRTALRRPDPLLLAAAAMRQGLSASAALAAITGRAARAVGATGWGLLRVGAPADLAGFDTPPLQLRAAPAFVMVGGIVVGDERTEPKNAREDSAPIALRAGRVLTSKGMIRDGIVLISGTKIMSVGSSPALPDAVEYHDFGDDALLAPGLIDAFGWAGLEPGAPPSGSSRLRAADAVDVTHPSLRRALASGVTSALVAPGSRGLVLGSACSVATSATKEGHLDVLSADAAFVFWLDDGPADSGPRAARLKALKELLQKAKGHHEKQAKAGADTKDASKSEKASRPKKGKDEDPDPNLDALGALFDEKVERRPKAIVRSGRQDMMLDAIDAFKAAGIVPILAGAEESDLIATELAQRGVTVVLSPRTTRRVDGKFVSVAAALRAAGVSVALGSFGYGGSDQLPLAACAAIRDGLSPEDALAALTTIAASLAGPADLGKLETGARADVVAWSGDPLEPASRVLGVVSGGRWIPQEATP